MHDAPTRQALLALPRSVPLDRALRLGSSLRALEQQKVLRMVKAGVAGGLIRCTP